MTRWRLRTEKMMLRAKQRRRWRCDYSWFICSSDFCNFSHLCLRGVCMCVRKRENKRVNKSTDVWARLLWLSLCLGLLLWLLGGASPADGTVGHGSTKLSVPQLHPWFLWTHSFELCMCLHRVLGRKKQCIQVLSTEFTLTRQGLDHSPCTTPSILYPSSHFMLSIQPTAHGLTDQFLKLWWLCRYDVSEC